MKGQKYHRRRRPPPPFLFIACPAFSLRSNNQYAMAIRLSLSALLCSVLHKLRREERRGMEWNEMGGWLVSPTISRVAQRVASASRL